MLSPGNVATPATAATAVVPERVPLPGFAPSATVTLPAKPVAVFPCPSSAVTCTAGVIAAPATVLLGWPLKLSCLAAPAGMLNGVELVPLRLPPLAVRSFPARRSSDLSPGNVATPATAATAVVPERVPLPGFAPSAIVTLPVKPVAVFPCPSSAVTCTAGVMDAPAVQVTRSEEHTSELQSHHDLVCRLLLEKKNNSTMALPCACRHLR